jgi:CheY-like chemotaxis protein
MEIRLSASILLADDVAVNRKLFSVFLEKAGAAVETAENGRIAVEKAAARLKSGKPFDLILMDMQMPELDGYAATTELRALGYPGPIIALTASAMLSDREKCLRAGCTEFLAKPVDRKKLLEMVEHFIKQGARDAQAKALPPSSGKAEPKEEGLVSDLAKDPEMAEIIQVFLEWLPGRIEALEGLRAKLDSKEVKEVGDLAHELKGAAGSAGFKPIQEAAGVLEGHVRGKAAERLVAEALEKLIGMSRRACVEVANQG